MFELTVAEILKITGGKLVQGVPIQKIYAIGTDSRNISKGCLFIPLIGSNFDGHNFVGNAFQKGARAVIGIKEKIPEIISQLYRLGLKHTHPLPPIILVNNTLTAYQQLANFVRQKLNPIIVGVTGSSGKTSTKEYLYAILNQFYPTLKSEENFNNEIGVPKTLLNLELQHKFGIIEMAMRAKGEINFLANIAAPNIGIITNIGSAHIGILGSKEEIANAKWELAEYLKLNSLPVVLNGDDEMLLAKAKNYLSNQVYFTSINKNNLHAHLIMGEKYLKNNKQYFTFYHKPTSRTGTAIIPNLGEHQISNALQALMVGFYFNLPFNEPVDISTASIKGRNEILLIKGITFINDAYNANPESMRASLKTFTQSYTGRKIVVLGEMKELGEESDSLHYQLGEFCAGLPIDMLCVVGRSALTIIEGAISAKFSITKVYSFTDNAAASEELRSLLKEGDCILFKASRAIKLEEVIGGLQAKV